MLRIIATVCCMLHPHPKYAPVWQVDQRNAVNTNQFGDVVHTHRVDGIYIVIELKAEQMSKLCVQ